MKLTEDQKEQILKIVKDNLSEGEAVKVRKVLSELNLTQDYRQEVTNFIHYETAKILEQLTLDGYLETGVKKYEFLAVGDNKGCKKCEKLNNRIIKVEKAKMGVNYPPICKNCRCTTAAYFDDDYDEDEPTPEEILDKIKKEELQKIQAKKEQYQQIKENEERIKLTDIARIEKRRKKTLWTIIVTFATIIIISINNQDFRNEANVFCCTWGFAGLFFLILFIVIISEQSKNNKRRR